MITKSEIIREQCEYNLNEYQTKDLVGIGLQGFRSMNVLLMTSENAMQCNRLKNDYTGDTWNSTFGFLLRQLNKKAESDEKQN